MSYLKNLLINLRSRNYLLAISYGILSSFIWGFFSWALPVVIKILGGVWILGMTYTIEKILSTPLMFLSGIGMDHYGRKKIIVFGTLIRALALALMIIGLFNPLILIIASAMFLSSRWIISDALDLLIVESVKNGIRATALSFKRSALLISSIVGSILLSMVASTSNLRIVMILSLLLSLTTIVITLMLKETLKLSYKTHEKQKIFLCKFQHIISKLRVLKRKHILLISIIGCLLTMSSTIASLYLPVYFYDFLNIEFATLGIVYAASKCLGILANIIAGRIIDSYGPLKSLFTSLASIGFLLFVISLSRSFLIVAIAFLLISLVEPLGSIGIDILLVNVTVPKERGTVFGALGSLSTLFSLAAPMLGALLWSILPPLTILSASFIIFLSLIPIVLLTMQVRKHEARKSSEN